MKRLAQALIHLYPPAWKQRYGDEFAALLEDTPSTSAGLFDLFKGAIKMQLNVPVFPKLAVMLSIAGLLAGLGVSFLMTPVYVSTAELRYQPVAAAESPRSLAEYLLLNENQVESRTSLSNVIQDPSLNLYPSELAHIPLEDVIEKMRRNIVIRITNPDTLTFNIQFAYPDRDKARRTVQVLITKFADANLALQRASAGTARARTNETERTEQRLAAIEKRLGMATPPAPGAPAGINLDVLDPPSLPAKPVAPNRAIFMAIGFGSGFGIAVIVAIFRRTPPAIPLPAQTA